MRLTTEQYWSKQYEVYAQTGPTCTNGKRGWLRQIFDRARLRQGARVGQSYSGFLSAKLLKAYLPVCSDWSAIEIGCAPGTNLVELHRDFGYKPYGVEYSHAGVLLTRETFRRHGFNADNVIENDLFDQGFQNKFRGAFDVVLSLGFIEHFDPPDEVVRLHINLLKPGGYLVCGIPNLRSLSYPLVWLFAHELLKAHNCAIMRKDAFRRLFEALGTEVRFCGYVGGFKLGGCPLASERSLRGYTAAALDRMQDILDNCMFLLNIGRLPESRWSSHLVFIGQRLS